MKILIIDRDELNTQMLSSRLKTMGHTVITEGVKNNAIDHLSKESDIRIVFVNPAPLNNPRPLILNIRRTLGSYVYIVLIRLEENNIECDSTGANLELQKPYNMDLVEKIVKSAGRISNKINSLGDDSTDFPSAGGVIAKSAFNQLFLSALDRADRHGESSYAVFISVSNYLDMLEKDGQYYADFAVAKMSQHLAQIRRQSDIIGQTERNEYALLLQRPQYETEPVDAANRFAEELSKLETVRESVESDPEIHVKLIKIPSGTKMIDHHITLRA